MNNYIFGFVFSFYLGGTIVWFYMRATFAKTRVPRTEFDELNSNYRDSIVENVKFEERISFMQERVEELNEKLLKAQHELSIARRVVLLHSVDAIALLFVKPTCLKFEGIDTHM